MSLLILIRHGESEGNMAQIITGQADVGLTNQGKIQAQQAAEHLRNVLIHKTYTSELKRAQDTLHEIQIQLDIQDIPKVINTALNERDFGSLTNQSKATLEQQLGRETYKNIIKGWDTPAPQGESLHMVYDRITPYFKRVILPDIEGGNNVLVVSHHQTLRALIKYLDVMSDEDVTKLALKNAEAIIYNYADGAFEQLAS